MRKEGKPCGNKPPPPKKDNAQKEEKGGFQPIKVARKLFSSLQDDLVKYETSG
jgi:hypothetical protein